MGRKAKAPTTIVAPISSSKRLMRIEAVCTFLGGIDADSFLKIRNDPDERFPKPLQMLGNTPMWSVDQVERYVERKQLEVEKQSA